MTLDAVQGRAGCTSWGQTGAGKLCHPPPQGCAMHLGACSSTYKPTFELMPLDSHTCLVSCRPLLLAMPCAPHRSQLHPGHVFGLVAGRQVFVWVGSKSGGFDPGLGQGLRSVAQLPADAALSVVKEYLEPPLFMVQFAGKREGGPPPPQHCAVPRAVAQGRQSGSAGSPHLGLHRSCKGPPPPLQTGTQWTCSCIRRTRPAEGRGPWGARSHLRPRPL